MQPGVNEDFINSDSNVIKDLSFKVECLISQLSKSPHYTKGYDMPNSKNILANIVMSNGEIISSSINKESGETTSNKSFMALLITILCPLSISRGFIKTLRHSLMAKALNALKEPLLFLMIHKVMIFWLNNCQPLSYIKSRGVYDISLTKAIYSCSIRH